MAGTFDQSFGLDPSVLQGLGLAASDPAQPPPATPPAPGLPPVTGGSLPDQYGGLHPAVAHAVMNGFMPPVQDIPAPAPQSVTGGALPVEAQAPLNPPTQNTPDYPIALPAVPSTPAERNHQALLDTSNAAAPMTPSAIEDSADKEKLAAVEDKKKSDEEAFAAEQKKNAADLAVMQQAQTDKAVAEKAAADREAVHQANIAKYTADTAAKVKAAADYKVDPNRKWNDLGTGGKIGAMVAIALSGIGDALDHRHGPNAAMGIIDEAIKQDVDNQWKQKEQLGKDAEASKGTLDTERQLTTDDRNAKQEQIATIKSQLADKLDIDAAAAKDPIGKARLAGMAAQSRADSANIVSQIGVRKANEQKARDDAAHARAELGLQYSAQKEHVREFDISQQNMKDEKAAALAERRAEAEAKGKGPEEIEKEQAELNDNGFLVPNVVKDTKGNVVIGPDGTPQVKHDFMKQEDGTPYKAPKDQQTELRKKFEGTNKAVDGIDQLRALIDENGGDYLKWTSDARDKYQETERILVGMHEASGIPGMKGSVMDVMNKTLTGGGDPTAIVSKITHQLDTARKDLQTDLNGAFTAANYTGKPISIPPPPKPSKSRTQAESDLGQLRTALPKGLGEFTPDLRDPNGSMANIESARDAGVVQTHKQILDSYSARLKDPNPRVRSEAQDMFKSIVGSNAKDIPKSVREYARKLLIDSVTPEAEK